MTYQRFEDLPVWKASIDLATGIYVLTEDRTFRMPGDLLDQLRRAALSVSNNIAEGYERGSTAELLMFLYIARGSAGETRSMLRFCERLPAMAHLAPRIAELAAVCELCSRQLRGWADSLQNSEIKGQRHLNEAVRETYDGKRRADLFKRQLEDSMKSTMQKWHNEMGRTSERENPG